MPFCSSELMSKYLEEDMTRAWANRGKLVHILSTYYETRVVGVEF